jgi:hypothetical protein
MKHDKEINYLDIPEIKMPEFDPNGPININLEDLDHPQFNLITREKWTKETALTSEELDKLLEIMGIKHENNAAILIDDNKIIK